jgi:hypothetical protein
VNRNDCPIANPHANNVKVFWVFLVIGLLILAGGIFLIFFYRDAVLNYDKVSATIVEIRYRYDDEYDVYVDYSYNGMTYAHALLDSFSSSWRVGDTLEIYVNPQDPTVIHSSLVANVMPYLVMGFGGLILAIALAGGVSDMINSRWLLPLRSKENKIEVHLTRVVHLKNQSLYRILFSKEGTTYRSGRLHGDAHLVETLLAKHPIDCVAYRDRFGNFVPDYASLNQTLMKLKNQEGLGFVEDYHGLSPNDNGSHRH